MKKQLFFDDSQLFGRDNVKRKYMHPERVAEYKDGVCSTDFCSATCVTKKSYYYAVIGPELCTRHIILYRAFKLRSCTEAGNGTKRFFYNREKRAERVGTISHGAKELSPIAVLVKVFFLVAFRK